MGTYGYWGEGNTGNSEDLTNKPVQITNEDKQYTASWEITGDGTGSIEFLMLEFDTNDDHFITKDTYPDLAITIDSVKVDGNEVDYKMSDNAVDYKYYANDTGTTRAYLLNTWNASGRKVTDISAETAVAQSVEVTFSVANVYAALPYGDLNEDGIVDISTCWNSHWTWHRRVLVWVLLSMSVRPSWQIWMEMILWIQWIFTICCCILHRVVLALPLIRSR